MCTCIHAAFWSTFSRKSCSSCWILRRWQQQQPQERQQTRLLVQGENKDIRESMQNYKIKCYIILARCCHNYMFKRSYVHGNSDSRITHGRKRKFLEQTSLLNTKRISRITAPLALIWKGKRARQKRENCAKAGKAFQSALFQLAWLKQKIFPANYTWTWNSFCRPIRDRLIYWIFLFLFCWLCFSYFMCKGLCLETYSGPCLCREDI